MNISSWSNALARSDAFAFKALIRQAIALNGSGKSKSSKKASI